MKSNINTKTTFNAKEKIWSGNVEPSTFNSGASIGNVVLKSLLKDPKHISQICHNNGKKYTNQEIANLSIRCAQQFKKLGLKQCDIFGICASNSDYIAPLVLGGLLSGLTASTLDPSFDKDGIKHTFSITKPKIMFCDGSIYENVRGAFEECNLQVPIYTIKDHLEGIKQITEFVTETGDEGNFQPEPLLHGASQIAAILCSSGTTGLPKGVCISHESLLACKLFETDESDTFLCFSSLYWLSGLACLICGSIEGASRVIVDKPYSPLLFFDIIEKYKVTITITPPSQLAMNLSSEEFARRDLSSLQKYFCGGSAVPFALVQKMKSLKPNVSFMTCYGMTEVAGAISVGECKSAGSNGQIVSNFQTKIINDNGEHQGPGKVGEICIKTPFKWAGYYGNPDATKNIYDEDGWIHSGDLGYIDQDGDLFVIGRSKDIMKYNNFHFFPTEIEEVICQMTGVAEVCVCGIPDIISTYLPAAAVVKVSNSKLTEDEICNYVAERLAHFKHLRGGVYFIDSIPKTASGKHIRTKVQKICEKLRSARINVLSSAQTIRK